MGTEKRFLSGEELQAMLCSHEQGLPTVGLKGFAPCNSWLENKEIEAALRDQRQLLEEERVEKRSLLSQAKWLPKKNASLLTKVKGRHSYFMGFMEDKQKYLHPEESLFLLESNQLELTYEDLPLSVEHAHALLLKEEDSLDKYQVYANLSRMGYKVVRHQAMSITRYERKINLDQYQLKTKKEPVSDPRSSEAGKDASEESTVVGSSEKRTLVDSSEERVVVGSSEESALVDSSEERGVVDFSEEKIVVDSYKEAVEGEGIDLQPVTGVSFKRKASSPDSDRAKKKRGDEDASERQSLESNQVMATEESNIQDKEKEIVQSCEQVLETSETVGEKEVAGISEDPSVVVSRSDEEPAQSEVSVRVSEEETSKSSRESSVEKSSAAVDKSLAEANKVSLGQREVNSSEGCELNRSEGLPEVESSEERLQADTIGRVKELESDTNEQHDNFMDRNKNLVEVDGIVMDQDEDQEHESVMDLDKDNSSEVVDKNYEAMDQDNECDVAMDQDDGSEMAVDESEQEHMDQDSEPEAKEQSAVTEVVMSKVEELDQEKVCEVIMDDASQSEMAVDDQDSVKERNEGGFVTDQVEEDKVESAEDQQETATVHNNDAQNEQFEVSLDGSEKGDQIESEQSHQKEQETQELNENLSKEVTESDAVSNKICEEEVSHYPSRGFEKETVEAKKLDSSVETKYETVETISANKETVKIGAFECLDIETDKEIGKNVTSGQEKAVISEITIVEDDSEDQEDSDSIDICGEDDDPAFSVMSPSKTKGTGDIDVVTIEEEPGKNRKRSVDVSKEIEVFDVLSPSKSVEIDVVSIDDAQQSGSKKSAGNSEAIEILDLAETGNINVTAKEAQNTNNKGRKELDVVNVPEVSHSKPSTPRGEIDLVTDSESIDVCGEDDSVAWTNDPAVIVMPTSKTKSTEDIDVVNVPEVSHSRPSTSRGEIDVVTVETTTSRPSTSRGEIDVVTVDATSSKRATSPPLEVEIIQVRDKTDKVVTVDLSDDSEDDCVVVQEVGKQQNKWYKRQKDIEVLEPTLAMYDSAVIIRSQMLSDLPSMNGEESIFLLPPKSTLLPPNIKLSKPMYSIRKNGIVEDNYENSLLVLEDEINPPPPLPLRKRPRRGFQQTSSGFSRQPQGRNVQMYHNRGRSGTNDGYRGQLSPEDSPQPPMVHGYQSSPVQVLSPQLSPSLLGEPPGAIQCYNANPQSMRNEMMYGYQGSQVQDFSPQPPGLLGNSPATNQNYSFSGYSSNQCFQGFGQEFQRGQVSNYGPATNVWDDAPSYNRNRNTADATPALGATSNWSNKQYRGNHNEGAWRHQNRPHNNWRGNSNRGFQKGMLGTMYQLAMSLNLMLGIPTQNNFRGGNRPWRRRNWGRYNRRGGHRGYHNRIGGRNRRDFNSEGSRVHKRFQDDVEDNQEGPQRQIQGVKKKKCAAVKEEKQEEELIILDDDSNPETPTQIKTEVNSVKSEIEDNGKQPKEETCKAVVKEESLPEFIALPKEESEESPQPVPVPATVQRGKPGWRRSRRGRGRTGLTNWNYFTRKHWGMPMEDENTYVSSVPKIDSEAQNWRNYKRDLEARKEREALHDGPLSILWTGEVTPLLSPEDGQSPAVMHAKMAASKSYEPGGRRQLVISFDVYLPDTTVRRSTPSLPHCRVIIQRKGEELPDPREVDTVLSLLDDDVTLLLAVNSGGRVLYLDLRSVRLPEDDFSISS